ncbi:MAG: hypothetical protein J0I75_18280 [Hyphomicrobium sp.]|nr:hypothetical protein [Hyphomicrobium sp.]
MNFEVVRLFQAEEQILLETSDPLQAFDYIAHLSMFCTVSPATLVMRDSMGRAISTAVIVRQQE